MQEPGFLTYLIYRAIDIYTFAIIIRAILSWFSLSPNNGIYRFLISITEPFLRQIRRYLPRSTVDFSPIIAIILLSILQRIIVGL
ncbi:MAG: YggT family protein [Candidatus Cloacimonetes bacterium]|nr:YggT family protein [Candidatus Cloacimonadota bacterium]